MPRADRRHPGTSPAPPRAQTNIFIRCLLICSVAQIPLPYVVLQHTNFTYRVHCIQERPSGSNYVAAFPFERRPHLARRSQSVMALDLFVLQGLFCYWQGKHAFLPIRWRTGSYMRALAAAAAVDSTSGHVSCRQKPTSHRHYGH